MVASHYPPRGIPVTNRGLTRLTFFWVRGCGTGRPLPHDPTVRPNPSNLFLTSVLCGDKQHPHRLTRQIISVRLAAPSTSCESKNVVGPIEDSGHECTGKTSGLSVRCGLLHDTGMRRHRVMRRGSTPRRGKPYGFRWRLSRQALQTHLSEYLEHPIAERNQPESIPVVRPE